MQTREQKTYDKIPATKGINTQRLKQSIREKEEGKTVEK